MSARGLPGFLRRSLRLSTTARDEDDDEEEEDDDENEVNVENDIVNHRTASIVKETTAPHGTTATTSTSLSSSFRVISQLNPSEQSSHESFPNEPQPYHTTNTTHHHHNNSHSSMNFTEDNHLSDSRQNVGTTSTTTTAAATTPISDSYSDAAPSSSVNDHNNNNSNNNYTIKKTYREQQYEKILSMDVIHMHELRALAWNGIPIQYRAMVWKLLLGYVPTNGARRESTIQRKRCEYQEAIVQYYNENDDDDSNDDVVGNAYRSSKTINTMSRHRTVQEQETLRQVLVDVPRTQPQIPLFRNHRIQQSLSRILYIWAIRHPASSYVQGINDLVTPLLTIFLADYYINYNNHNNSNEASSSASTTIPYSPNDPQQQHHQLQQVLDGHVMNHCSDERLHQVEADVYWCLTNLLSSIQDHYTADQPGLQRMVGRLEELVYRIDKDLTVHIRDEIGIQFLQFSFKWMNCLLLREFHLKCIFRLWDTYLSEKDGFEDFHVYVCAAFMCQFSHQLQTMTFDELFGFMQDIPTNDWTDTEIEVLLSQAFVLSTLFKGSDAHLTNNSSSV
jgi:TBC1 domain family member 2